MSKIVLADKSMQNKETNFKVKNNGGPKEPQWFSNFRKENDKRWDKQFEFNNFVLDFIKKQEKFNQYVLDVFKRNNLK